MKNEKMLAMRLIQVGKPLELREVSIPKPSAKQVLIKVQACGVCRTDLHIIDGELIPPRLPLTLGHQIIGTIVEKGSKADRFSLGTRVGIPWLGKSCGVCVYCIKDQENLCDAGTFTGFSIDGGFAEYCVADEAFIFLVPSSFSSEAAAPLFCGGLIGYRALEMAKGAKKIGFYGFGSAAHLLIQICTQFKQEVFVFTRPGDLMAQELALTLGAVWAGSVEEKSPVMLDAAIIFAPAGELVPLALKSLSKGGMVICAGIHMSPIPSFPYESLYGEKMIRSVTNLTRADGAHFFEAIQTIPIHPQLTIYRLEDANRALNDLREGKLVGSAVLRARKEITSRS